MELKAALISMLLCVFVQQCLCRSRDSIEVVFPKESLPEPINAQPALFGAFFYGRKQTGPAFLASDEGSLACDGSMPAPAFNNVLSKVFEPFIMIANRGSCTFVQKAVNAQSAGASALIIVNNSPSPVYMGVDANETTFAQIVGIPLLMVDMDSGRRLMKLTPSLNQPKHLRLTLIVAQPEASSTGSIDVDLYTRVNDPMAMSFKQNFGAAALALGSALKFNPHYILSSGRSGGDSKEYCTHNGLYCASSAAEVEETLRQLCIAKDATDWFKYVSAFQQTCGPDTVNLECSKKVMAEVGIEEDAVLKCIQDTNKNDGSNELLKKQLEDPRHMHYSPMLVADGAIYESALNCFAPVNLESCPPLKFFCLMFENSNQPKACMTSSVCSIGQIVDACGTCSPIDSKDFIYDWEQCPEVLTPEAIADANFRAKLLIVLLAVAAIAASAIVVYTARRRRKHMRSEIDRVMAEYTELNDDNGDWHGVEDLEGKSRFRDLSLAG